MNSRRQERIGHLIQEAFSEVLQREGARFYGNKTLVTITSVNVTPDLTVARINLSVFNTEHPEAVIHVFDENKNEFRHLLGNKLRHNLRKIPELEFYRDDTLDYVDRIDNIFKELNKDNEE